MVNPPRDLLFEKDFLDNTDSALRDIVEKVTVPLLLGVPICENGHLYNSVVWIEQGEIKHVYHKRILPNYSVFDEKRYFSEGDSSEVITYLGKKILLTICEDLWRARGFC